MKNSKYSTLIVLLKIMARYDSFWSQASQRTILKYLEKFHRVKINRRMLNYHLADLRAAKFIRTIKRHKRNNDGTLCLLPSAHCITLKGYAYLASKAVALAWTRLKALRAKYFPGETIRHAIKKHIEPPQEDLAPKKYNPFLDPDFRRKQGLTPVFKTLKDPA